MKFLNAMERRFGNHYINGLAMKLVIIKLIAFVLINLRPTAMENLYNGQGLPFKFLGNIFYIITYPPALGTSGFGFIFSLIAFYIFHMCTHALESYWGQWRFNAYVFLYFITAIIAHAFFLPYTSLPPIDFIDLTCFIAFCTIFRNMTFYLFFVLPVPAWVCGLLAGAPVVFSFASSLFTGDIFAAAFIMLLVSNYLSFFVPELARDRKQIKRKKVYESKVKPAETFFHKCSVCGITDQDDPEVEFRYNSSDDKDYCQKHFPQ